MRLAEARFIGDRDISTGLLVVIPPRPEAHFNPNHAVGYQRHFNPYHDDRGRFAPKAGGAGGAAPIMAEPTVPPAVGPPYSPDPTEDADGDGVTDRAVVGVAANEVPPPPAHVPRLPNLTADERAVESSFADKYEADPDGMAKQYLDDVKSGRANADGTNIFGTDDTKYLAGFGGDKDKAAQYNTAIHQTANAIAKRAFVMRLDELKDAPEEQRTVLVTAGGCAAGKGYALGKVRETQSMAAKVGAVWDSAGEQNGTENPWILAECAKRNIRVAFVYVHADPASAYKRAISRANEKGRMIDARVFADSYAIGGRNFHQFMRRNAQNPLASFHVIDAERPAPARVATLPRRAYTMRSRPLWKKALDTTSAMQGQLKPSVIRGAVAGTRIWGSNG
jgi:hypothetical protein